MKSARKLIPALVMLLVSAIVMSSASFAWFSMNKQVTATGMEVKVKSNAVYLLIGDDETKAVNDKTDAAGVALSNSHAAKYATTDNTLKSVYPVTYKATAAADTTIGNVELQNASGYDAGTWTGANKWFTANNGNANNANDDVKNILLVTEGNKDYMLHYQVWLTLSKDSESSNDKIKVTATFSEADASVSALVVIGENRFDLDSASTTGTTAAGVALTSGTAQLVDVYVYMDGESTNINSAYKNSAEGVKLKGNISLQFDLVA